MMAHVTKVSLSADIYRSSSQDEDISVVRDVARKTLETLELNINTCLKINKLVDAITADQGSAFRRWSRGHSDLERRQFKNHMESLRQKEDTWHAMKSNALNCKSNVSGETYTTLGSAMMSLQSIDKRLREEIVDPLKKHLVQKTTPDYARFHEVALPLGEEIFKMGDVIEHEFIRMRANSVQPTQQKTEDPANPKGAKYTPRDSSISLPIRSVQPRPPDEGLAEEGRAGIMVGKRAIAITNKNTRTMSASTP